MLTLYQSPTAVCAIKVRLVLAEKGLAWEARDLNLRAGDQHKPDYLSLNPAGVVPTLVHDGRVLVESSVIMQYLDELTPEPPLQPQAPYQRARMRLWMKSVDEVLHPGNVTLTYATLHRAQVLALGPAEREAHFARIPDAGRRARQRQAVELGLDAPDALAAVRGFSAAVQRLDASLAADAWAAGADWSLADAALTPYMDRLEALGLSRLWSGARHVTEWLERIRARPSYAEAVIRFRPAAASAGPAIDAAQAADLIERARAA